MVTVHVVCAGEDADGGAVPPKEEVTGQVGDEARE